MTRVSGIVVSHGHAVHWRRCCPLLLPQVDELVVVANTPGSVAGRLSRARAPVLENQRSRRLAENVNLGIAATRGRMDRVCEPGRHPRGRGRRELVALARDARAVWRRRPAGRCGPTARGSRRAGGSRRCAARSSGGRRSRRLFPPLERQRDHYLLDEDVDEPVEADWLLGAFLLMRRTMLDELGGWDEGYRHYVEDIDLCYRAMRAGWERWYVPRARVTHDWAQVSDRQLPLAAHGVARAEHGSLRPRASGDPHAAL